MKTSKLDRDLVFYGAPASGKSTQALLVGEQLGMCVMHIGAVLRKLAKGKSDLAKRVAVKVNSGQLVSAVLTAEIIAEFLSHNRGKSLLFEGVPRNVSQAKALDKLLDQEEREILFVLITLPKTESLKRLKDRAKKESRMDDHDPSAIKKRFDLFTEESEKLVHYFGPRLVKVTGTGTVKQVTARILKAIKDYDSSK
jgi:adenylate kinase